jgi:PAS domain S-box-containing protein
MENKHTKKVTGMSDYIKKTLDHDFKYLSDVPDIQDKELSGLIKTLAEKYRDSLLKAEKTARNIIAIKEENEKLIERQNVVLNNSLVGIVMVRNRLFVQVNKKMADLFGYDSPDDMLGKSSRIVYASEEDFNKVGNNAYSALSEGKEYRLEYIAKRKDGSKFWCLLSGKSIDNNNGANSSDSVWVFQDITKEKEIDMMKTDFISTVSHELRTPLTSIIGFANIILKKFKDSILPLLDTEDKKIKKTADRIGNNLEIIVSEGQRLTVLINDVLDIAKMEAGKIEWKDENFTIEYAIDCAIAATSSLLEQKRLNMITDIENNIPEISGDKDRFIQVIINLISNAVKFMNSGDITIRAKVKNGNILVSVTDQGIGINKENADKVFEKFKQVGDTLTDKPQGTGLGLPICRQIIDHYGGKIWVDSEEGKGSTFCFTVSHINSNAYSDNNIDGVKKIDVKSFIGKLNDSAWQLPENGHTKKNILIVDDDPGIRELLKQELENEGYITDQAADGVEALHKTKHKKYNLIILDVMMPGLSGFDISAVLKSNPDTMNIPIMILSMIEDKKRGFEAGVDKYLTKGIDSQNLLKEVDQLIAQGSSKRKVMIIDKDESIFNMLTNVMREKGYAVMGISSKADTDYISKIKTEQPNIIIIDEFIAHEENIKKTLKAANESGNMMTFIIISPNAQKN